MACGIKHLTTYLIAYNVKSHNVIGEENGGSN